MRAPRLTSVFVAAVICSAPIVSHSVESVLAESTNTWRFTGAGSVVLIDRSEGQIQAKGYLTIEKGDGSCSPQSSMSVSYSISPNDYTNTNGQFSFDYSSTGLCSPLNHPFNAVSYSGLKAGTTYTICLSVKHGVLGSVSVCDSWATLGDSTPSSSSSSTSTTAVSSSSSTSTTTVSSSSSTSTTAVGGTNGSSSTSSTTNAPPSSGYMVLLDTQRRAIDVWTLSKYNSWDPNQLPLGGCGCFKWVASSGVPSIGMIHDGAGSFSWPTTTTTTTTVAPTTTTAALTTTSTTSPSSVTIEPTTTSSSPSKSGNTDTTEAGSGGSSSESSSNSSSVSSSTTTTAVPNGEVRASVGGVEVEVETKVENNAVTVSVGEVTAGISNANTSDNSTIGESQQGLVLSSGESADVSIDGLQPNSEVEVVIYSSPRNLGSLQVNEFGELVASIEIPSNMESGPHTLVLKGFDKFGKQIELKFGLVVYSPDAYIPVWVWFLIGLLLILLAASLVLQKNKKVIITT